MKKYFILLLSTTLIIGCTKNDNQNNTLTHIASDGNFIYGSSIAGALHVTHMKTSLNSFPAFTIQKAMATFFSNPQSHQNAGIVTCNDSVLTNTGSPIHLYLFAGMNLFNIDNNPITWKVQGNPSEGIASFTHIDTQPMPKNFDFTATTNTINLNNSFTITYPTLPSNVNGIFFIINGDNGDKSYGYMQTTNTSMTFSSADLKSVIKNGTSITISAAPTIISTESIGGRPYNFIKTFHLSKTFPIQ